MPTAGLSGESRCGSSTTGWNGCYQRQGGAESKTGFRITTATAAVLWLLAVVVIPAGTPIPPDRAIPVCLAMAVLNSAGFLFSAGADTLDRQHSIVSVLTAVERPGHPLARVHGRRPPGIRDQRDHAAVRLRVRRADRLHLCRVAHGRHRRRLRRRRRAVSRARAASSSTRSSSERRWSAPCWPCGSSNSHAAASSTRTSSSPNRQTRCRLEKDRADALLLNVLPGSISSRLLAGERTIADAYPAVTVLFADIVGFTPLTGRLPADEVVGMLGRLFGRFDELVAAARPREDQDHRRCVHGRGRTARAAR